MRGLAPFVVLLALVFATPAVAVLPTIPVTACGQEIPPHTIGALAADLDCTGFNGGTFGIAVTVGKGSIFDLGGFTLTGGQDGAACLAACPRGSGFCSVRCTIRNGTIKNAVNAGVVGGDTTTLDHVTILDSGDRGVDGGRQVKIYDSTISGSGVAGLLAKNIVARGVTITGNGRIGISTTAGGRARVNDSTVVDNDASAVCTPPTAVACYDIGSGRRPDVRNTTCKRSFRPDDTTVGDCNGWCVCSED